MKFELSEKQVKQFEEWSKDTPKARRVLGVTVENFMFSFQRHGIGDLVMVTNIITGDKISLTDIDSW